MWLVFVAIEVTYEFIIRIMYTHTVVPVRSCGYGADHQTAGQEDRDSNPPAALSKPGQLRSPSVPFGRDTKSSWSFPLVSTAGEVKDLTQGNDKNTSWTH